ncbi:ankyrin repeat domain-containing protein [Cypionkella sinensis]|uniref:Ankyrin repeat domain-containing protein n=1 Tax=Cypionkella sinensis TaxID=1756043 RepID=A0ABV7J0Q2_9RHOB
MTDKPPLKPRSFAAPLGDLRGRGLFWLRLVWRIAGRAVLQLRAVSPALPPAKPSAAPIADPDQVIEALQTGEVDFLVGLGPEFAASIDAQSGQPWLFHAIDLGSLASLHWFLAQGVDLASRDKAGRLPLQAAVERAAAVDEFDDAPEDPLALIDALLEAGAQINAASAQGLTALHVAAALGLLDVVTLLLERGADANLRDEGFAGSTALDYAVQARQEAVAEVLRAEAP